MPFGPVSGFTYGNGVTDARSYDLDYRTTAIKDSATGNIVYSSYGYDADNNVTSVTDHVNPGWTQALTYDVIDQINYASGPYGVISQVKYDSGGNWTKYDTTTYQVWSTSNRLKKIGGSTNIVYDSAGHMTAGIDSSTMTYNKAGQLASIAVFGNTANYKNDGFGWRVTAQTGTNPLSVQLYDQSGNFIERSASNVMTDYVWMDGFPVAAIKPSTPTITDLHTDPLAAPVKGTDASKAVVWAAYYAPFGGRTVTTSGPQQDLLRKGLFSVNSSNVNRNGFRDFSFQSNVFYEPDPAGFLGGLNRYIGNLNNPLKYFDPFGLDIWVEGPNANEPHFHQSINVGNPNGYYYSYSFGVNGHGIEGEVYRDTQHGGEIQLYKKTTPQEDAAFHANLESEVGSKGLYGISDICGSFSQREFNAAPGTITPPPIRPDVPSPTGFSPTSTTTRGVSTTGTSTSQ